MAQIILEQPIVLLLLPAVWLAMLALAWPRRFKPAGPLLLRLALLALLGVALTRPVFVPPVGPAEPPPEQRVLLVDQSASLGQAGQAALRAEAARLGAAYPDTALLYFGGRPVFAAGLEAGQAGAFIEPEQTNLAAALTAGANLLHQNSGRLALLTDGAPTAGDTLAAARQLAGVGLPVDVLLVPASQLETWQGRAADVSVAQVSVPPVLRQGQSFAIEVTLHSHAAVPDVTLRVEHGVDQFEILEDTVALSPGLNQFTFETRAGPVGLFTVLAQAAAAGDPLPVNNSLAAVAPVYPPPTVLVVSADQADASRFATLLQRAGFQTRRIAPALLPARLSELEAYSGMVLLNVSAREVTLEQMIAVQEFGRSLGSGILFTGGRESLSLGGYADTPLADLLPVSLEPPPREERPPVALLLMIDHSGSMVEKRDEVTKLAMAKEAAIRAVDFLGPDDLLGVLMFDDKFEWVVPFQPVQDGAALLQIEQAIAAIAGGGGTRILPAMAEALPALMAQKTAQAARHAVLLTDGKSFDSGVGLADYEALVEAAQAAGVTLSTIAIGRDADEKLLMRLAELGKGRYHFAAQPDELPELTIAESNILRSQAVQEGDFTPAVAAPHAIVRGLFGGAAMPNLAGYIALTSKPLAEVALQTGPGDPLLAVWGYGLGRVAVWASDTGAEWAAGLTNWPNTGRFWGQVVGYTLPGPGLGLLQVSAAMQPDGVAIITAEAVTAAGQPVDLAPPTAVLTTSGGRQEPFGLRQVAPGRYQQQVRLPNPGPYGMRVTQARPGQAQEAVSVGLVRGYAPEYAIPPTDSGLALLRQVAALTGGQPFGPGDTPPGFAPPARTKAAPVPIELWWWPVVAALGLWPVEIAWRRWARLRIQ
jgi:Mg-chelatase subunit ChlD